MVKRLLSALFILSLLLSHGIGEERVTRNEGEMFFPEEKNWVYHFTYAYPYLNGEDYTAALINDTYQMALDEMTQLVLPMFANAEDMRFDGKNEVNHDFSVLCDNGVLLSILQTKRQSMGEEGAMYTLEPLTFDVSGQYAGETLTLRGVILIQAGVDPEGLDDVRPEEYPEITRIISESSSSMADRMMPVLYDLFMKSEGAEAIAPSCSYENFEMEFSPTHDFAADEEGNVLFFFPPMLLAQPGTHVPVIRLTPTDIEAILEQDPQVSPE